MSINTNAGRDFGGGVVVTHDGGLTPGGVEYLRSDVTLLREGLNNIKGKAHNLLFSPSLSEIEKEEFENVLREIYDECDRVLWMWRIVCVEEEEEEEKGEEKGEIDRDE